MLDLNLHAAQSVAQSLQAMFANLQSNAGLSGLGARNAEADNLCLSNSALACVGLAVACKTSVFQIEPRRQSQLDA